MSRFEAPPGIITNGLILNLDAGDPDSYTRSQPPYVEVLVVAGGGGGGVGSNGGGGGGAGGLIYNSAFQLTNAAAITVTVGAGGASTIGRGAGNNGSNSVFSSLTATGGGGGGGASGGPASGKNGGSGGGAQYSSFGGSGTAGQGTNGGDGNYYLGGIHDAGGGGGGAGASGLNATATNAGNGGNGSPYSISGVSTYYAGGGGGSSNNQSGPGPFFPGIGGLGGGGNGGINGTTLLGTDGVDGLGAGGGAGVGATGGNSGAGGDGIVIVRYPGLPAATGGTITYLNGYTIHTFTTSGTFTPYLWNSTSNNSQFNVNNGTSFIPYVSGGTFDLDGTDDYLSTGSLNLQQNWTLEIWTNMDDNSSFGLFGQGITAGNQGLHILYQSGTRGMIYGMYGNDNDYMNNYRPSPATGAWYHWVFTYNVSTYDKQFYADSVLQTPGASTENAYAGSGQFNIGATYSSAQSPANGKIAVSRFYNRVLSQAEITQNYNATRARFGK
jgi:hypothetical protein